MCCVTLASVLRKQGQHLHSYTSWGKGTVPCCLFISHIQGILQTSQLYFPNLLHSSPLTSTAKGSYFLLCRNTCPFSNLVSTLQGQSCTFCDFKNALSGHIIYLLKSFQETSSDKDQKCHVIVWPLPALPSAPSLASLPLDLSTSVYWLSVSSLNLPCSCWRLWYMLFSLPRRLSPVIDDSALLFWCKYDLFRESLTWVISPHFPQHFNPTHK